MTGYNFIKDAGLSTTGGNAGYNLATPAPEIIVGQAIQSILTVLGIAFLAFMMYAGIMWMTAQGNDQKVERAKQMITEAIVGIIIVVAAYAITYFIIKYFGNTSITA